MVEKHDTEKEWECQECGNSLESQVQPQECPCGSTAIEAQEQLSLMEQMMQDFIQDDNQGES